MTKAYQDLNPAQREAIEHIDGPILVLAGAGSGKTKTLTTRLAYLIDEVGIPAHQTLMLTFTNKASKEMRERALSLMSNPIHPPLLCTFHRFGLMFLKFYIRELGRGENFVLLDSDDKKKLIKQVSTEILRGSKELMPKNLIQKTKNEDEDSAPTKLSPGYLEYIISQLKNSLILPEGFFASASNPTQMSIAKIYQGYQQALIEQNLIDFDDLILLPYQILEQNQNLAMEVSRRYAYIMVDEYQDTNFLQFKLLEKLCSAHQNLCVVGDDDQSIYGWRGAEIGNILNFHKFFPDTKTIRLEENYRSSQEILEASNQLIAHNKQRLGKVLYSHKGRGENVELLHNPDENLESQVLAKKIQSLLREGARVDEIAILFRLNALSRALEDGLNKAKIPYCLIGTIRFYERAEIKDILAYLRYLINDRDDFSLERIINQPKRGIGKTTKEAIFSLAKERRISVAEAFSLGLYEGVLSQKILKNLKGFFGTLEELRGLEMQPERIIGVFLDRFELRNCYEDEFGGNDRLANIQEFQGLLKDYFHHNPTHILQDFLNDIPLESELDMQNDHGVKCMSIHTAKGLEFDYVFVIGLEEGFTPLLREGVDMEEERRLTYVAFTRARKKLFVSYVDSRYHQGIRKPISPSRFLLESQILKSHTSQNIAQKKMGTISKGDLVLHKVFGTGRVEEVRKSGEDEIYSINFGGLIKPILSRFVTKVES
ncbi:ATP-dependent helicase [Helicobacter mustelae]|uniref:DNA 3'-5' helicase n=1 Tax=Helicobacter mustelae (strain ATCC 43772 / CCUG 25715 / CIP 103759 / LMG 18044 / NCTC 12198 / R85-136P) TaxID=679897 RepID=D3UGB5_HELM1|nr:UvrD-helicase domain-containing protein [Helicobacter mustelae]CBG39536.1 ATP-dependent DNA helicase [Helicobacter mustelae 12198]SQH71048.1 ATP-dependent DNA helicase [Helicobacter mustelae]